MRVHLNGTNRLPHNPGHNSGTQNNLYTPTTFYDPVLFAPPTYYDPTLLSPSQTVISNPGRGHKKPKRQHPAKPSKTHRWTDPQPPAMSSSIRVFSLAYQAHVGRFWSSIKDQPAWLAGQIPGYSTHGAVWSWWGGQTTVRNNDGHPRNMSAWEAFVWWYQNGKYPKYVIPWQGPPNPFPENDWEPTTYVYPPEITTPPQYAIAYCPPPPTPIIQAASFSSTTGPAVEVEVEPYDATQYSPYYWDLAVSPPGRAGAATPRNCVSIPADPAMYAQNPATLVPDPANPVLRLPWPTGRHVKIAVRHAGYGPAYAIQSPIVPGVGFITYNPPYASCFSDVAVVEVVIE